MRVTILGKRWELRPVPKSERRRHYGFCEAPDVPNKTIVYEEGHSSERTLETLIHEFLHAGHWNLSEESVSDWSRDVARILTKLGWKR